MSDDKEYIKELEIQNERLRSSIERYALVLGASYKIDIVDRSMDILDFSKIMDYYVQHGWVLHSKRLIAEQKRRWEYYSLPDSHKNLLMDLSSEKQYIYKNPFSFPYKPRGRTMANKYGQQVIEAINKFNLMLHVQAAMENKLTIEIYDYWVKNFKEA